MAGDWIPWCKGLAKKPEIFSISRATGRSRREVACTLMEFWEWCDGETDDGHLVNVSLEDLPEAIAATDPAFWLAVVQAGWLSQNGQGLVIPNYDRWLGKSAKKRIKDTLRQQEYRARKEPEILSQNNCDKMRTTVQKSIEEKNTKDPPNPPRGETGGKEKLSAETFLQTWNSVPHFIHARGLTGKRLRSLQARSLDKDWLEHWREALDRAARLPFFAGRNDRGWRATIDWFLRPDSVTKLLEGCYDGLGGKGPPPKPRETKEETARRVARERAEQDAAAKAAEASRQGKGFKEFGRMPPS